MMEILKWRLEKRRKKIDGPAVLHDPCRSCLFLGVKGFRVSSDRKITSTANRIVVVFVLLHLSDIERQHFNGTFLHSYANFCSVKLRLIA